MCDGCSFLFFFYLCLMSYASRHSRGGDINTGSDPRQRESRDGNRERDIPRRTQQNIIRENLTLRHEIGVHAYEDRARRATSEKVVQPYYRPTQGEQKRKSACLYWICNGNCQKGRECEYEHDTRDRGFFGNQVELDRNRQNDPGWMNSNGNRFRKITIKKIPYGQLPSNKAKKDMNREKKNLELHDREMNSLEYKEGKPARPIKDPNDGQAKVDRLINEYEGKAKKIKNAMAAQISEDIANSLGEEDGDQLIFAKRQQQVRTEMKENIEKLQREMNEKLEALKGVPAVPKTTKKGFGSVEFNTLPKEEIGSKGIIHRFRIVEEGCLGPYEDRLSMNDAQKRMQKKLMHNFVDYLNGHQKSKIMHARG